MADEKTTEAGASEPTAEEIRRYLNLNEKMSAFEASMFSMRGYGAFDRSLMPLPDPVYMKVAAWLTEKAK